jgi:hypothetical protein
LLVVHNWGTIEVRAYASKFEAYEKFKLCETLRRFVVRVHDKETEAPKDNSYGWVLPWEEMKFGGFGCVFDNQMRSFVLDRLVKS